MIASLRGTVLVAQQPSFLVVEVGGVGFKVFVPASVFDELDGVGRGVFLHTYLIVREDALTLYGFSTEEQRALFELLLTVQGVGPRLGMAVPRAAIPAGAERTFRPRYECKLQPGRTPTRQRLK